MTLAWQAHWSLQKLEKNQSKSKFQPFLFTTVLASVHIMQNACSQSRCPFLLGLFIWSRGGAKICLKFRRILYAHFSLSYVCPTLVSRVIIFWENNLRRICINGVTLTYPPASFVVVQIHESMGRHSVFDRVGKFLAEICSIFYILFSRVQEKHWNNNYYSHWKLQVIMIITYTSEQPPHCHFPFVVRALTFASQEQLWSSPLAHALVTW